MEYIIVTFQTANQPMKNYSISQFETNYVE